MQNKALIPLLGAIAIPVILILFVLVVVFLPANAVKPSQNFVYSDDYSRYYYNYKIVDNHFEPIPAPAESSYVPPPPKYYMYDVKTDKITLLSESELKALKISEQPISEDGYRVLADSSDSYGLFTLFFGGGNDRDIIIKGKNGQKRLDRLSANRYNFYFVGWVLP